MAQSQPDILGPIALLATLGIGFVIGAVQISGWKHKAIIWGMLGLGFGLLIAAALIVPAVATTVQAAARFEIFVVFFALIVLVATVGGQRRLKAAQRVSRPPALDAEQAAEALYDDTGLRNSIAGICADIGALSQRLDALAENSKKGETAFALWEKKSLQIRLEGWAAHLETAREHIEKSWDHIVSLSKDADVIHSSEPRYRSRVGPNWMDAIKRFESQLDEEQKRITAKLGKSYDLAPTPLFSKNGLHQFPGADLVSDERKRIDYNRLYERYDNACKNLRRLISAIRSRKSGMHNAVLNLSHQANLLD